MWKLTSFPLYIFMEALYLEKFPYCFRWQSKVLWMYALKQFSQFNITWDLIKHKGLRIISCWVIMIYTTYIMFDESCELAVLVTELFYKKTWPVKLRITGKRHYWKRGMFLFGSHNINLTFNFIYIKIWLHMSLTFKVGSVPLP